MSAARLTPAEARALGIDVAPTRSSTRQRRVAPGPSVLRCTTCSELLDGEAAQRRHSDAERHWRQELVL